MNVQRRTRMMRYLLPVALLLVASAVCASAGVSKPHQYSQEYEAVWNAAIGALQIRGYPVVVADKGNGIITTDFRIEPDGQWRHKFNILVVRSPNGTSVSAGCSVSNLRRNHALVALSLGVAAALPADWRDEESDGKRESALLNAIERRLQAGGVAADAVASSCVANFVVKGAVVRGTTYATSSEFPGLAAPAAVTALAHAAAQESPVLTNIDTKSGNVTATDGSGRKPRPVDFTLTSSPGSVRISVVETLGVGDRGNDEAVRERFCRMMDAVAAALPLPPEPVTAKVSRDEAASGTLPIEERLKKLDELYKKGLITEDEYKKKRADLLKQL
jgi:hypothetical protein